MSLRVTRAKSACLAGWVPEQPSRRRL